MKSIIFKKLFVAILCAISFQLSFAYDFQVDGICYNVIDADSKCVEVTQYPHRYSGDISIPLSVLYNEANYNVIRIGESAFFQCEGLTSIEIPNSVVSIGENAFFKCKGLTSLLLPNSVTTIEEGAFRECSSLTSVNIPNSITVINDRVFQECSGLVTIKLPDGLKSIGYLAFCGTALKTIEIPNSVVEIGNSAFGGCRKLESATMGNSVKTIGDGAFSSCEKLSSFIMNDQLLSIGEQAFYACGNLTSIVIPDKVSVIKKQTFQECMKLESVILPKNLTEIGDVAFRNCVFTSIEIPDNVKRIGKSAFELCEKLKSVKMPHDLTSVDESAFNACRSLSSISIPEGVKSLPDNVFNACSSLVNIICYSKTPPVCTDKTFPSISFNKMACKLSIPKGALDAYKSADEWNSFGKIEEMIYRLIYKVDGEEYKSYDVECGSSIVPEEKPTKEGYSFSGWNNLPEIMPAEDVTVTGLFTVNSYKLTYMVDGKEYKSYDVEYGSPIIGEESPQIEGYTFSGWSWIPSKMPAENVTVSGKFSVNSYKLTYIVDGEEFKTATIAYGTELSAEPAPTKEGYTFSGWSEIPATMPAEDVVVTGTFSVNSYKLTYMVDSEEYKSYVIEYGSTITPESEPKKEGYIFSGWSIIPATMPAKDVTITGTFSKGQYKVTYIVDGVVYKTIGYDYEAAITPEAAPTKEGYTFSGWSEIPATMPAKDVTVTGSFTVNSYKLTYMVDGEEYKSFNVVYGSTITPESEPTKEGYIFSGWSEIPETMPAKNVVVTGTFTLDTTGIDDVYSNDDNKEYYDLNGVRIIQPNKGVNIIKMSDGSIKKIIIK